MRRSLVYLLVVFTILSGCKKSNEDGNNYIEAKPLFFALHNGSWLDNKWIRDPKNLIAIHETLKNVGYMNLLDDEFLFDENINIHDIYINKQFGQLLDSLQLTYSQKSITKKYYREFWERRKKERNDSIVFVIIKDINFALKNKLGSGVLSIDSKPELVNDTLYHLLNIEYRSDSLNEQLALKDFETLRKLGFHQSAYNLLFNRYKYQDLKWNRDSLKKTLKHSKSYSEVWFQDDTK
ncbi:hypothetical protein NF867_14225 [Solitalea sp. MAHUQ-68]|uniref:Uncharacterized protein n=1 Tax=Solitalea agri TaxID=2953739 RepID=A0A9X2F4F1_9SPHI|nr:hypothetical protein [Solitalea agri]MCO4294019.1 hypothetical protein [Solitalea agri]